MPCAVRFARMLATLAVVVLLAVPLLATAQTFELPPEGTLVISVAVSDGVTVLPVAGGTVAGIVCWAAE